MEFDFGIGVVFRQSSGIRVSVVVRRQDPDVARQVIRIQFRSGPVRKKSGFLRRILQRMHPLYSRLRNCYPAIPVCVKKMMLMLLSMIKPNMNTQYDIVIHRRKYPKLTFVSLELCHEHFSKVFDEERVRSIVMPPSQCPWWEPWFSSRLVKYWNGSWP